LHIRYICALMIDSKRGFLYIIDILLNRSKPLIAEK
jgi:hypothetical protein